MAATLGLGKKSWALPADLSPLCICVLNEWCQAAQAELHWELHQKLGQHVVGRPANIQLGSVRSSSTTQDPEQKCLNGSSSEKCCCKGQLGSILQRRLCRPIIPGDVEYISQRRGSQWICTVYLHCVFVEGSPPVCFTGGFAGTKKEAEESTAREHFQSFRRRMRSCNLLTNSSMATVSCASCCSSCWGGLSALKISCGPTLRVRIYSLLQLMFRHAPWQQPKVLHARPKRKRNRVPHSRL